MERRGGKYGRKEDEGKGKYQDANYLIGDMKNK